MAREPYPSETADRFIVRLPEGMRDRIREEAEKSGRSMNAEIVVRLEQSLNGAFLNLSTEGFVNLIKRFEAAVEASEDLYMRVRDDLKTDSTPD